MLGPTESDNQANIWESGKKGKEGTGRGWRHVREEASDGDMLYWEVGVKGRLSTEIVVRISPWASSQLWAIMKTARHCSRRANTQNQALSREWGRRLSRYLGATTPCLGCNRWEVAPASGGPMVSRDTSVGRQYVPARNLERGHHHPPHN